MTRSMLFLCAISSMALPVRAAAMTKHADEPSRTAEPRAYAIPPALEALLPESDPPAKQEFVAEALRVLAEMKKAAPPCPALQWEQERLHRDPVAQAVQELAFPKTVPKPDPAEVERKVKQLYGRYWPGGVPSPKLYGALAHESQAVREISRIFRTRQPAPKAMTAACAVAGGMLKAVNDFTVKIRAAYGPDATPEEKQAAFAAMSELGDGIPPLPTPPSILELLQEHAERFPRDAQTLFDLAAVLSGGAVKPFRAVSKASAWIVERLKPKEAPPRSGMPHREELKKP